ncbi:MAG: glycosyltransferase family 4 protein [Snowella sp.]|nr:glycosyltransferase family 4 protein [Snowella sp.]
MKILQICNLPSFIKQHLRRHIDHLTALGFTVESVCPDDVEIEELKQEGYIVHTMAIDRSVDPISNYQCIVNLVKLIKKNHYDIVHVHNPVAALLGRIAAKIAGVKAIIYTSHGFYFHELTPPLQYLIFCSIEILATYITDLIFSVNHEDINVLLKTGLCSKNKLYYLGSVGVDLKKFNPDRISLSHQQQLRQFFKISEQAYPIIGTIGRINEKKGSLYFIEAIHELRSQYPHIQALIIGAEVSSDPDGCKNRVLDRIYELNLASHITLTGYQEEIPELLSLMDIFTLPTFTHEGLPSAVIEAMAMQKPVVASNIRGCREAIIHQKTGLIIPPKNIQALADALRQLLMNPEKAKQMGLAGRKRVEEEYSLQLVLNRLTDGYDSLGLSHKMATSMMYKSGQI